MKESAPLGPLVEVPLELPPSARVLQFRWVPPGAGVMGLPASEPESDPEEFQVRSVIRVGFYLADAPITSAQWRALHGISHGGGTSGTDAANAPKTGIDWAQACDACSRLTQLDLGATARLPTEQQWEHAARAGTQTKYYFGDDADSLHEYEWFGEPTRQHPFDVGQKKPNPFGLFDMLGNVFEWCRDTPQNYVDPSVDRDASGEGPLRCVRGTSFRSRAEQGDLMCGRRGWLDETVQRPWVGVRPALEVS